MSLLLGSLSIKSNIFRIFSKEGGKWGGWWQMIYLVVVAGLIYLRFAGWAYDDPYIIYRYAANLIRGLGPVYNPGERVLSATSALFMLLLALLGRVWPVLPRLANWLGALGLALGGLCLWELAKTWQTPRAGWAGLLLYPIFPLVLSTLGSEMPLYLAACLGTLLFYARRNYQLSAVLAACAVLLRPDGVLVTVPLVIDYLLRGKRAFPWKPLLVFLGLVLPWVLFAWIYYGSPLPVTLAAKQHQGAMAASLRFAPGFGLVLRSYAGRWHYWLAAGLALVGAVYLVMRARRWGLLLGWTLLYFMAYALLGVSRYYWYYAPLVPGFIALVGLGVAALLELLPAAGRRWLAAGGQVAVTAALLFLTIAQGGDAWRLGLRTDPRSAIYRAVGQWLQVHAAPEERVGALEVGIIGYYARRPMIDFAGLIQPAVAAQLGAQTTYDDAAVWAATQYRPEFLALRAGSLPRLEQEYVSAHCALVEQFPGEPYGYPADYLIYACQ